MMNDKQAAEVFQSAIIDLCIANGGTLTVEFQDVPSTGILHTSYQRDRVVFKFMPDEGMTKQ